MKIPMKSFLLSHIALQKEPCSYRELTPFIQKEYSGEGQASDKIIRAHLESLRAVGALEVVDAEEEKGKLVFLYKITDYGVSLLKYIKNREVS